VRYIVVGPLERAYYDEQGLKKFEYMAAEGTLDVAFDNEGVTIYEVVGLEQEGERPVDGAEMP